MKKKRFYTSKPSEKKRNSEQFGQRSTYRIFNATDAHRLKELDKQNNYILQIFCKFKPIELRITCPYCGKDLNFNLSGQTLQDKIDSITYGHCLSCNKIMNPILYGHVCICEDNTYTCSSYCPKCTTALTVINKSTSLMKYDINNNFTQL